MRTTKISVKTAMIAILLIILFFQNWLLSYNAIWGYVDEIVALIALLYFLRSSTVKKKRFLMLILASIIIIWGIFCNIRFEIQDSVIAVVEDILSNFKFLFVYLGIATYVEKQDTRPFSSLRIVLRIVKIYLIILMVCAILNLIVDINMSSGIRYGFRMFSFVYGTPGHLINQMTYATILLVAENEYFKKNNMVWRLICAFIMIATMKTRAFILITVYGLLVYFFKYRKKKRLALEIGIIGVFVLLVGFSQFEYYFSTDGAPRQIFVAGAIRLVKEYFPFGTGFGTYGSSAAAEHYSQLYYYLGYSMRWGMTPDNTIFMNDNYLPMIFAEFGLIFALIFLILLFIYSKNILSEQKHTTSINCRIITYAFLADILLSSIQSSYLAHYSVVTLSLCYFLFFYLNRENNDIGIN